MIVTAAITMARKAENSRRIMSENPKRSLLDSYIELSSRTSCKKQEIRWMKSIIQLLDSIQGSADNKAVIEQLEFLENSDLICTCRLSK
jgi:gamma-glutamylcysteine synthetase